MLQVDPWEKAADCERALRLTIDPVHRENLANIREFWISLANARPFLSEGDFVKQAEAIGNITSDWADVKPEEVADAIFFFASPRSDYITGQVLSVSGGLTMVG